MSDGGANGLPAGPRDEPRWKALVELLGALAGVALVFYFVGALLIAVELWALGLPFESAIILLPSQTLAVAGGRALLPGLVGLALLLLILRWSSVPIHKDREQVAHPAVRQGLGAPFIWAATTVRNVVRVALGGIANSWSWCRGNASRLGVVAAELLAGAGAIVFAITNVDPTIPLIVSLVGAGVLLALAAAHAAPWLLRFRAPAMRNPFPDSVRRRALIAASIALLVGIPLVLALLEPQSLVTLVMNGLLAITGGIIAILLVRTTRSRVQAYGLFSLVVVFGTALQLVHVAAPPTRLDFATVRMKDGTITDGYFIGGNSDTVYIAPNVADRLVGIIAALPRAEITSVTIQSGDAVSKLGGGANQAVIGGGSGTSPAQQAQQDDVYNFLAGIRTDPGWIVPPVIPYGASQFLKYYYGKLTPDLHPWESGHPLVAIHDLVVDPDLYTGDDPANYPSKQAFAAAQVAPYDIRGRVVETAVQERDPSGKTEYRLFVLAPRASAQSEAYCNATVPTPNRYHVGDSIDVLGLVVAWGRYNVRAGAAMNEVALVCASVRPTPGPRSGRRHIEHATGRGERAEDLPSVSTK
jgi:hypothetical protein